MREIPLHGSLLVALVDDEDWPRANLHRWYVYRKANLRVVYAQKMWRKGEYSFLHNFVLGQKGIDHKNRNGLDCRKSNLRRANKKQNAANSVAHKDNKTGTKGVVWDSARGKFAAYIGVNGKTKNLGRFSTKEAAQRAYANAAVREFGEFARV